MLIPWVWLIRDEVLDHVPSFRASIQHRFHHSRMPQPISGLLTKDKKAEIVTLVGQRTLEGLRFVPRREFRNQLAHKIQI